MKVILLVSGKYDIVFSMKLKKLIFLPLIATVLLPSCDTIDKAHAILVPKNYNASELGIDSSFDVDVYTIYNLLSTNQSFALEMYLDSCSHCRDFAVVLDEYIKKSKRQIYRCQPKTQDDLDYIHNVLGVEFADVFGDFDGVPTFQLIDDGKLTYTFSPNKFVSYTAFNTIAKKHFYNKNYYTASNKSGVEKFANNKNEYLIYCFDHTSTVSADIMAEIYDYELKKDKNVLIINKNELLLENYLEITTYLEVNPDGEFALYAYDGKIEKTTDCTLDGGTSFKNFLASYFA